MLRIIKIRVTHYPKSTFNNLLTISIFATTCQLPAIRILVNCLCNIKI